MENQTGADSAQPQTEPIPLKLETRWQRILRWSRAFSGVITVVGAALVFFSWLVTNTLKEQNASAKAAIQQGEEYYQLSARLSAIQASNSLQSMNEALRPVPALKIIGDKPTPDQQLAL